MSLAIVAQSILPLPLYPVYIIALRIIGTGQSIGQVWRSPRDKRHSLNNDQANDTITMGAV
jgi:hypothetical protein